MSGLLGIAAQGATGPGSALEATARWLVRHPSETSTRGSLRSAAAAVAALPPRDAGRALWCADGVLVAVHGQALDAHGVPLTPERLGRSYLESGPGLLERLTGRFALAIVVDRPERREALIATDRIGTESMCFAEGGGTFAFGTRADAVATLSGRSEVDPQALYDYLYFHMVPAPRTIYRGVRRLLPGSLALWRDGRVETRCYWRPGFVEDDRGTLPELVPAFKQALQTGVARASDAGAPGPDDAVGCFLSGGTDSSTVAGMLGRVTGRPARTFSIGFDAQGYDEVGFARIAARHFACVQSEYYVTPDDVAGAVTHVATAHDQPFGNASVLPAYCCARFARERGITRLLAGDGGDELFGGNDRYAMQHIFSLYGRVPGVLRQGVLDPVLQRLPAVGVLRKAKGYARQANIPLPERLQTYNLLERLGAPQVFDRDFLAGIDVGEPTALLRESYHGADAHSQINRLLALDLRFTLADSDLPKVNRACELAGVEVAYPLLDADVVDFSLRLRPDMKLRGTRLRWFFKEALRDFLPREVLEKQKHGFGLPFGPWLRDHARLRELAGDTLAGLRRRRIVNDALLDDLMNARLAEHAAYYGTLVWVLMTLALWLDRPLPGAPRNPQPLEPVESIKS